jgi:peptidoglycan/LPS O-acetylase OafA/YrhL
MFALAAPLSIAAGYGSWHVIENRALRRFKPSSAKRPDSNAVTETLRPESAVGDEPVR